VNQSQNFSMEVPIHRMCLGAAAAVDNASGLVPGYGGRCYANPLAMRHELIITRPRLSTNRPDATPCMFSRTG
jgi:hypothetical protein